MTGMMMVTKSVGCREGEGDGNGTKSAEEQQNQQNQVSLFALLIAALRKSMVACRVERHEDTVSTTTVHQMEIGWPTNVRHITHVTFDRFNGFLGLPVEFEVEIPCRVPSASASVFGVSAESMQLSYDSRGNSVPTILLLMQERLYSQAGLKAEGIFRINPENSQEELVRDQLNRGIVPEDIEVHCLAGLIKAWFRELPEGVLDGLSPEQVLQYCNTEEESVELVKQLMPTQAALLNWAIDLMADVVEEEESNKMNARNIAMVFAPNMTQMSDPLTALMHAVQVMNLLKTLIMKTVRERKETATGGYSPVSSHSSGQHSDEDYDSQQEMDTSCELGRPTSDYDDHANYSHSSGDENEDEEEDRDNSSNQIEECFLRQLNGNEEPTYDGPEEAEGNLGMEHLSHGGCSGFNTDSAFSSSNSKYGCSGLSTSDAEDSGISEISMGELNGTQAKSEDCQETLDSRAEEKLDKQMESLSSISLPVILSVESG
ncbi:hypothetical protein NE237_012032 [Protea cynaroides]|uniref:Rho GTPase-activating protein 2-like n=1 Tax=Protea cynaroides TaxID=273540 RepID=A0A9Q0JWF7_9MAGN|nr:hypothetical protein NE237_012032 [Protea cynaroides]